jgi:hypothetical protein
MSGFFYFGERPRYPLQSFPAAFRVAPRNRKRISASIAVALPVSQQIFTFAGCQKNC